MTAVHAIEPPDPSEISFHPVLRVIAQVISVIFHPLFIPFIGTWLVIETHQMKFAAFDHTGIFRLYASVVSNMIILTGFTIVILKLIHFISSIRLPTQRDQVIPYIATMTFYFWAFLVMKHQDQIPPELTAFILGCFIAVVLAFISNVKLKISMHALGMGGLLGLMFCFFSDTSFNIALPLIIIILAGGIVCTSRMILGEHTLREIYLGAMFGIMAQLIASWVIH